VIVNNSKGWDKAKDDYWSAGLWLSVLGHFIVVVVIVIRVFPNFGKVPPPVVYSISIEGGKVLGGASQVPKDARESKIAPIKKTAQKKEADDVPDKKVDFPPNLNAKKNEERKPAVQERAKAKSPVDKKVVEKKTADKKTVAKTPAKKPVEPKKSKQPVEDVDKRLQDALQRYLGESSQGGGKGFGAAKLGGKNMGGGLVRPPEFFVYEKIIRSRIKDAWRWYDRNSSLITVIAFDIGSDGVISNVQLVKSSGDAGYDDSVVRAATKASPLPAPPQSVYERYFKKVRITFDPRD
jgi:colicin import membrane protein